MSEKENKAIAFRYDLYLIMTVLGLLSFGLLMVGSASMVISDRMFHTPFHYLIKQAAFVFLGLIGAWGVTRVPLSFWYKYSRECLLLSLFFLLLVLIPGLGRMVNGSRRWLNLGFCSLQISEFVKLSVVIYLSGYLTRYADSIKASLGTFLKPMVVLSVVALLLLMEPDFGGLTVISIVFLSLLFLSGGRLTPFIVIVVLVVSLMAALAVMAPYRLLRLTTFLHPWDHAYGSGYQLTQSLIAFGRGGWFGVGLGNSIQKLHYLPEAHSDFIFAVIAEELGFAGEMLLILLFTCLAIRLVQLAREADSRNMLFSKYVCYGVAVWISIQAMINMGVTAGVLPTKGLTLPFISYGGSSILVTCITIGIVLRVSYELSITDGAGQVMRYRRW